MKKKKKNPLKKLQIPADVNCYDKIKEAAATNPEFAVVAACLDDTLSHFNLPKNKWRAAGDAIQRYSMLLCLQDSPVVLKGDDPALHWLTDMVEYYNRLAADKLLAYEKEHQSDGNKESTLQVIWRILESPDGQHRKK